MKPLRDHLPPQKQAKQPKTEVHVTLVFTIGGQRVGDAQFDALPDAETGAITMPIDAEQIVAMLVPAVAQAQQQRQQQASPIIVPGRNAPAAGMFDLGAQRAAHDILNRKKIVH